MLLLTEILKVRGEQRRVGTRLACRNIGHATLPDEASDLGANLIERQNLVGEARLGDGTGHAPDDTAGFVLNQNLATGRNDRLATTQSILPHAGEHHRQRARAVGRRH